MAAQTVITQNPQNVSVSNPHFEDVAIRGRATTLPRDHPLAATSILTSGVVSYTYFTARKTILNANRVSTITSVVTATVTNSFVGVYEENPSTGDLTRVATSADLVASAWLAADAFTDAAMAASFDLKAGRRYAVAVLSVATTPPILVGSAALGATFDASVATTWGRAPKMAAQFAGQTSLVASVTNAQAAAYTALPIRVYAEVWAA